MENFTILELRKKTGLSQRKFAEKYHISLRALQSWEQGWRNTPESTLYMLQKSIALENYDTMNNTKIKHQWIIVDDCEKFIAKCPYCGYIIDSRIIEKHSVCPKCKTVMNQ